MRGLQRALDSLSQYGGPEGRISTFISKPSAVLEEVRHRNPKANVLLSDEADQSLEILFPENVLGGLLTELVNNAVKFSRKDSPTVCVNWHMQDNRFICCIDDDGTDPPISPHEKHIPLDLLLKSDTYSDEKPHGLRIVNRVIRLAKGLMLFSRAPILGGLRVLLDIPVLAHRTGAQ
jgi:two-component sensor histidine kinase